MGLLSKLLGKDKKDLSQTDRYRMVSGETLPSTEQERMNRDLMESQMAESRAKRDAEQADHKS